MDRQRRGFAGVAFLLILTGLVLLLPDAYCRSYGCWLPEEIVTLPRDLVWVPVRQLDAEREVTLTFRAPETPVWKHYAELLGEPAYLLMLRSPSSRTVDCFPRDAVSVSISQDGKPVTAWESDLVPDRWGFLARGCLQGTIQFAAERGRGVEIRLRLLKDLRYVGDAEIVAAPYWKGHEKDRLVFAGLHRDILHAARIATPAGVTLIGAGVFVIYRRRKRA